MIVFPIKNNDPQKTKYSIMQELENYKKDKLTINIVWANVFGILILIPITLIFGLPYYLRWGTEIDVKAFIDSFGPLDVVLVGLSVFIAS